MMQQGFIAEFARSNVRYFIDFTEKLDVFELRIAGRVVCAILAASETRHSKLPFKEELKPVYNLTAIP